MRSKLQFLVAAFLLSLGGYLGWQLKPAEPIKIEEKIVYKEAEAKMVERVITRTIKKDGDVSEIIKENEISKKEAAFSEVKVSEPQLSRYSLGVALGSDVRQQRREFQLLVGARLGDLPLFMEIGGSSERQVLLGVRWEF